MSSNRTRCWSWPLFCFHVLLFYPPHQLISLHQSQNINLNTPPLPILDIEMNFEEAAAKAKTLPESVTNEEKLSLYGLYKQATVGDVEGTQPWVVQVGMFFFFFT